MMVSLARVSLARVALALVLLGGSAVTEQCEWVNRPHVRPGGLMLASPLEPALALDVSECRARCCRLPGCDTAVHETRSQQCHLLFCDGKCAFQEDDGDTHSVFVRSDAPPPGGALHIEPLMLDPSAHGEEQRTDNNTDNNNNNNNSSSGMCALPPVVGVCKAAFPRVFYDSESKTCRSFTYGGCGGNANNFRTVSECQAACGGGGGTGADEAEAPSERKTVRMAAPPPGEEEEEVLEVKDVCALPRVVGMCEAAIPRVFYDSESKTCRSFTYGGCGGNANNFRTMSECQAACGGGTDVCALPPVVGFCEAIIPRVFYDSESKTCRSFTYGGCGGNANNFRTVSECQAACGGGGGTGADEAEAPSERKTVRMAAPPPGEDEEEEEEEEEVLEVKEMSSADFKELCVAPPVVGPCRAAFPRWFYNDTRGRCQKFIYGGCKGNKNNHESEEQCRSACAGVKLLPSKKKQLQHDDDHRAHCSAPPETGPCRAAFPSFYFDPETQSCRSFLYGGCRGNANRYDSEAECEEQCLHRGASSEGRGLARNRWMTAFFLFLTLGGVSFLLVTALIFITMRRRRGHAPRRTLSIRSDKEELLQDSERSSVDSLPLPESPDKA